MKIDIKKIDELLEEIDFSGVVYVRQQESVLYQQARHFRDRRNQLKNTLDTRFGIASGTKLITALGIMKLVELGRIKLDDPAFSYIPQSFKTYDQTVTIKQLLSHTSGLPDYFDEDEVSEFSSFQVSVPWYLLKKPSDYLAVMPQKEMKFKPGTAFNYNNSGFIFLAMIIEFVTGDYYRWIEDAVFKPAKMTESGFFLFNQLPSNTANGYVDLKDGNYRTNVFDLPIRGGGDGGMFTTAKDIDSLWTQLFKGDIVSKETVEKMIEPVHTSAGLSYGLGVWLKQKDGGYYPLIIGEDSGVSFQSEYRYDVDVVYVVLSNTQEGAWPIVKQFK